MADIVYPRTFVDALPAYDGRRVNPFTVALTKREEDWMVRRRGRIEDWYQAIGCDDAELLTRLRDDDDAEAAEFELFVYATLRSRNGVSVEWGPVIQGQRPDLGAVLGGASCIVEVFTREEHPELRRRNRRLQEFKVWLEEDGGVNLDLQEDIPDSIEEHRIPTLGKRVAAALAAPMPGMLEGPEVDLARFGLKGTAARLSRKVTLISGPAICGDAIEPLRDRLVEKAQKYKWLKSRRTPYVVVVCAGSRSLLRRDEVEQAMLGREVIQVGISASGPTGEASTARKIDGVVRPATPRTGKPRYSRISAVVFCERDDTSTETLCRFAAFHNPYAMNPVALGAFGGFPELTWTIEGQMYVGNWSIDPDTWFAI